MSDEEGAAATEPRLFAVISRERGEEARRWLMEKGLLDLQARTLTEGPHLLLPLSELAVPGAATPRDSAEGCGPRDDGTVDAGGLGPVPQNFATHFGATFTVGETQVRSRDKQSYQMLAKVPDAARAGLPQSFDQIGDIAVVKFDEGNAKYEREVAQAILSAYKGIRVVAADEGVGGELRVRRLRKLAGEGTLATLHKEFGISMEVDLERAFFTPRLAGERRRVALLVAPYERVLDGFAGVGPISLHIAKLQPTAQVDALDINTQAVELIRHNSARNKLSNLRAIEGDFRDFAAAAKPHAYSRIVMNLPHRARDFLPQALPLVASGGLIHLYSILALDSILPEQGALKRLAEGVGHQVTILRARPIKSYSPTELYVVFDLRVDRAPPSPGP